MVNFTVEEALANLKNPFWPAYVKKDTADNSLSKEGVTVPGNLVNKFTEETWKEFCNKYGLKLFNVQHDSMSGDTRIYANYDTCAVVMFKTDRMQISGFYWADSAGEYHSTNLVDEDLSGFFDNYFHAVFPKKANNCFIVLADCSPQRYYFFPSRDKGSTIWELVYKNISSIENDENSDFIDKVCSVIKTEVDEDIRESVSVEIKKGEKVFRINIGSDGSYADSCLEVVSVGNTYVELLYKETLGVHSIYTYRGEFWNNFERTEKLKPELTIFILKLFSNILDEGIINSILKQEEYKGEISFTGYAAGSGFLQLYSERFKVDCNLGLLDPDDFHVFVKLNDSRKNFEQDVKNKVWAEGFYTDILLALALGNCEAFAEGIINLSKFCEALKKALIGQYLFFDSVASIFSDVEKNVMKVLKFLESTTENPSLEVEEKQSNSVQKLNAF